MDFWWKMPNASRRNWTKNCTEQTDTKYCYVIVIWGKIGWSIRSNFQLIWTSLRCPIFHKCISIMWSFPKLMKVWKRSTPTFSFCCPNFAIRWASYHPEQVEFSDCFSDSWYFSIRLSELLHSVNSKISQISLSNRHLLSNVNTLKTSTFHLSRKKEAPFRGWIGKTLVKKSGRADPMVRIDSRSFSNLTINMISSKLISNNKYTYGEQSKFSDWFFVDCAENLHSACIIARKWKNSLPRHHFISGVTV